MSEAILSAIRWATAQFDLVSESPRLDAEVLLAHCLDKPRSYLYSWPERELDDDSWQAFQQLVQQRLQPMPIAYLTGEREFFSRSFRCRPNALVPRPETELLVELALQQIPPERSMSICDLGTGTGIIAVTLKLERPRARVVATDIDPLCVELARENAALHGAEISCYESDWYRGLPADLRFDLIVANPPYIAADHAFLARGDLPAEPQIALTPGDSGLEALTIIVAGAADYLVEGGQLILEHGYDQQAGVAGLLETAGFSDIRCENDHNNLPRTTIAKRLENARAPA